MASTIGFVLANFTLTFLVVGLIASAVALIRSPKPLTTPVMAEALFAYSASTVLDAGKHTIISVGS